MPQGNKRLEACCPLTALLLTATDRYTFIFFFYHANQTFASLKGTACLQMNGPLPRRGAYQENTPDSQPQNLHYACSAMKWKCMTSPHEDRTIAFLNWWWVGSVILCVCVKINKRSFEPFCVWISRRLRASMTCMWEDRASQCWSWSCSNYRKRFSLMS